MATGIGITLPITRGQTGYFAQSFDIVTAIKSNLINLIMTRPGERPFEPTFGCEAQNLLFEQLGDQFDSEIEAAIKNAVGLWMPFINITSIQVASNDDFNTVVVTVSFQLKTNTAITDTIVVVFA